MINSEERLILSVLGKRKCQKHQTFSTNCTVCGTEAIEFFVKTSGVFGDTKRFALELREVYANLEWLKQRTNLLREVESLDASMDQLRKIFNRLWEPFITEIEP